MNKNLEIALDIAEPSVKNDIFKYLSEFENIQATEVAEGTSFTSGSVPDIAVFYAKARSEELADRIRCLRQKKPEIGILVISPDKTPEHVVDLMKAGADEFLPNPLDFNRFKSLLETIRRKFASMAGAKGRLYSFISAKGGLGSTVIAVNTASALAMKNQGSVALLDMSLQSGDSSVYLDAKPQSTLADICRNFHRLDFSLLKTSMQKHSTGLHYLAAPTEPEDSVAIQGAHLRKIMQIAKSNYEDVVVDCTSMQVDECSLEAFKTSDRIFLLTDLSVPAVRNAARLGKLLQRLGISPEQVEVVVNRFIRGGAPLQTVEGSIRKKIFWLFPNDFTEVINSINEGIPLVKSKPGSPFSKSVVEFVEKLKNPEGFLNYRGAKGVLGKAI